MARIVFNPAIQILSGDIAGFVYRQQEDGSVIVAKRGVLNRDRLASAEQLLHRQRFKEAAARCKRLLEDATLKQAYQRALAERGPRTRLWAMVVGDILKAPTVPTIDLAGYHGVVGDPIRVLAEDNVGVARLTLVVHDITAALDLETAEKDLGTTVSTGVEWVYLTTAPLPDPSLRHEVEIRVTAYDLAGNATSFAVTAAS